MSDLTSQDRQKLIGQPDCDRNCPIMDTDPKNKLLFCCKCCHKARLEFYQNGGLPEFSIEDKEIIRKSWNEKTGFASENGCILPRRLRPMECLAYNCREYMFFSLVMWVHDGWLSRTGAINKDELIIPILQNKAVELVHKWFTEEGE